MLRCVCWYLSCCWSCCATNSFVFWFAPHEQQAHGAGMDHLLVFGFKVLNVKPCTCSFLYPTDRLHCNRNTAAKGIDVIPWMPGISWFAPVQLWPTHTQRRFCMRWHLELKARACTCRRRALCRYIRLSRVDASGRACVQALHSHGF